MRGGKRGGEEGRLSFFIETKLNLRMSGPILCNKHCVCRAGTNTFSGGGFS